MRSRPPTGDSTPRDRTCSRPGRTPGRRRRACRARSRSQATSGSTATTRTTSVAPCAPRTSSLLLPAGRRRGSSSRRSSARAADRTSSRRSTAGSTRAGGPISPRGSSRATRSPWDLRRSAGSCSRRRASASSSASRTSSFAIWQQVLARQRLARTAPSRVPAPRHRPGPEPLQGRERPRRLADHRRHRLRQRSCRRWFQRLDAARRADACAAARRSRADRASHRRLADQAAVPGDQRAARGHDHHVAGRSPGGDALGPCRHRGRRLGAVRSGTGPRTAHGHGHGREHRDQLRGRARAQPATRRPMDHGTGARRGRSPRQVRLQCPRRARRARSDLHAGGHVHAPLPPPQRDGVPRLDADAGGAGRRVRPRPRPPGPMAEDKVRLTVARARPKAPAVDPSEVPDSGLLGAGPPITEERVR